MKPTPSLSRRVIRLPLTTKQVNNGFYKGTGSGAMGRHTKHGGYVIEWKKVRTYVVPEQLKECKVGSIQRRSVNIQAEFDCPAHSIRYQENAGNKRKLRRGSQGPL